MQNQTSGSESKLRKKKKKKKKSYMENNKNELNISKPVVCC